MMDNLSNYPAPELSIAMENVKKDYLSKIKNYHKNNPEYFSVFQSDYSIDSIINNNLDDCYDMLEENLDKGIFGINIHRATKYAGKKSTQIDKWSAGCQVIASNDDWTFFMKIMRKARDIWGNSFSYTLLESKEIIKTWI